jgi:type IV secretory pathway VirB10-like protein
MLVAVGALVLAAVAVGAYTVAKLAEPASTSPSAVAHGNPSPRPEPTTPDTTQRLPETAPPKPDPGPAPESSSDAKPGPETNQAGSAEKPQSFKVKGADLTAALTMLGAEAGVQIVVAPGMGKRKVDADYENVPLSEILSDLGRRYGFTPFDQGDGTIIVVPARDSATASGSDAEIVRHQREDERIGQ